MNQLATIEYLKKSLSLQNDALIGIPLENVTIEIYLRGHIPIWLYEPALINFADSTSLRVCCQDEDSENDSVIIVPYKYISGLSVDYLERHDSPSEDVLPAALQTNFSTDLLGERMNRDFWKSQIDPFVQRSNVQQFAENGVVQVKPGYELTLMLPSHSVGFFPKDRLNLNDDLCLTALVEGDVRECVHRIVWKDIMGLTIQIDSEEIENSRVIAEQILMGAHLE